MIRLVWLTDLHLNFVNDAGRARLIDEIRDTHPDHLLIGGDVAEAKSFVAELEWIARDTGCRVSFVLGNHDYYKGSIEEVRRLARELSETTRLIRWLPVADVVSLNDDTALLGHGGWGDARAGSWDKSEVILNDYVLIEELRSTELTAAAQLGVRPDVRMILNEDLQQRLQTLGDEAAAHLRTAATEALANHGHVFVLMHVPPFREACWHEGRLSDDNWAPHFVCAAAGDALREVMAAHPDQTMTVLCGHTHSGGEARILPNLTVLTGEAHYGRPAVQRVFEFGASSDGLPSPSI